jgi:hypothetical protein
MLCKTTRDVKKDVKNEYTRMKRQLKLASRSKCQNFAKCMVILQVKDARQIERAKDELHYAAAHVHINWKD